MLASPVQIPVVDFRPFVSGNGRARQAVARQIRRACRETGFVYLSHLRIPQALVDQAFAESQRFFNLSPEVKNELAPVHEISPQLRGSYFDFEREFINSSNPGDLKEFFEVFRNGSYVEKSYGREQEARPSLRLQAQGSFCKTAEELYTVYSEAASWIFRALAISFELPEFFFEVKHRENYTLRLLHYPFLKPLKPAQFYGAEHLDYSSITLLNQNGIEGLEIRTIQGEWISAPCIPDAVLVVIGHPMQRWTNNELRSTPHRVVMPRDRSVTPARYSTAFFCDLNSGVEVVCLESCQGPGRPPLYSSILADGYNEDQLRERLPGVKV